MIRHEGTLSFGHKFGYDFLEAICNSFGDNFICGIAKTNEAEVFGVGWRFYLGMREIKA